MAESWQIRPELNVRAIDSTMMIALQLSISPNILHKQNRSLHRREESDLLELAVLLLDFKIMENLIFTILIHLDPSQNGKLRVVEEILSKFANFWKSTTRKVKVMKKVWNWWWRPFWTSYNQEIKTSKWWWLVKPKQEC